MSAEVDRLIIGIDSDSEPLTSHGSEEDMAIETVAGTIKEAALTLGVGRTPIYKLIAKRQLATVKLGRRTVVTVASIRALVGAV